MSTHQSCSRLAACSCCICCSAVDAACCCCSWSGHQGPPGPGPNPGPASLSRRWRWCSSEEEEEGREEGILDEGREEGASASPTGAPLHVSMGGGGSKAEACTGSCGRHTRHAHTQSLRAYAHGEEGAASRGFTPSEHGVNALCARGVKTTQTVSDTQTMSAVGGGQVRAGDPPSRPSRVALRQCALRKRTRSRNAVCVHVRVMQGGKRRPVCANINKRLVLTRTPGPGAMEGPAPASNGPGCTLRCAAACGGWTEWDAGPSADA
jgi:hypothetical protein